MHVLHIISKKKAEVPNYPLNGDRPIQQKKIYKQGDNAFFFFFSGVP